MNPLEIANKAAQPGSDRWLLILLIIAGAIAFWALLKYFIKQNENLVATQLSSMNQMTERMAEVCENSNKVIESNTAEIKSIRETMIKCKANSYG